MDAGTPGAEVGANRILERNLVALALNSPRAAEMVRLTAPLADAAFPETDEDVPGLVAAGRTLASRRRPMTEARRLAGTVDVRETAAIAVQGFGAGYHVRVLGEAIRRTGLVICFEPDVALLRAVLERVDHSGWLASTNVVVLTEADERAPIAEALSGMEGLIGLGVKVLEHPASKPRLGTRADRFGDRLAEVLKATKMTVMTTLVQSQTTLRNALMNLDVYVGNDGVGALAGAASGRTAVVVSAGPSLERNVDLLGEPGVRERVVIVAVQTVLRPLLARGIRPHFVCALDHHEISRRFYEGLRAEDVEGVTLVIEPKANPAIAEAWPGVVRCVREDLLEELLGGSCGPDHAPLKAGATVAHLCYYLARHLGCDPVALIGQDLGFTDGQYYAPGAAIHEVWAPELNGFRSLETFEWERIVRARTQLRRVADVLGRPMYTDEQMASYLNQFEVDFRRDREAGRRVIDATEGGVAKAGTEVMSLAAVLAGCAGDGPLRLPEARGRAARVGRRFVERVRTVRQEAWRISELCGKAEALLGEIRRLQHDQRLAGAKIAELDGVRDRVTGMAAGYRLACFVNQLGTLNRIRADRSMELDTELTALERQTKQIDRDEENVRWMRHAADDVGELLDATIRALEGRSAKLTRDETPIDADGETVRPGAAQGGRVEAIVTVDDRVGGLGTPRDLGEPFGASGNALCLTVRRLLRARRLDGIRLITGDEQRVRGLLGDLADRPGVAIERWDGALLRERAEGIGRARLFAPSSWRGAIGGLTCYDESLHPGCVSEVMSTRGIDACVLVGADWALVDPALIDACVERYRERPAQNRIVFTQAAPGLAGLLVDRRSMENLGRAMLRAGPFGGISGLLGYVPVAPQSDPIGKHLCLPVAMVARNVGERCIPDSRPSRRRLIAALGDELETADAERAATLIDRHNQREQPDAPREVVLEICTGRLTGGRWGAWVRGSAEPVERPVLSLPDAHRVLKELAESREDMALTLHGAGDPLMHDRAFDLVQMAVELGIAGVHVRTNLLNAVDLDGLRSSGVSVISVDLLADDAETYRMLTGCDRFDEVVGGIERLVDGRAPSAVGLQRPWIVPRMTRCDEVYGQIESFYDRWLVRTGSAAIDPLPCRVAGARIQAMPVPGAYAERTGRERVTVLSDGRVVCPGTGGGAGPGESGSAGVGDAAGGDTPGGGVLEAWRRIWRARRADVLEGASEPAPVAA